MSQRANKSSLRGEFAARQQGADASEHRPNSVVACATVLVTPELRQAMISEAAYYLAEQRGFEANHDLQDWLRAESQIEAALACGGLPDQRSQGR